MHHMPFITCINNILLSNSWVNDESRLPGTRDSQGLKHFLFICLTTVQSLPPLPRVNPEHRCRYKISALTCMHPPKKRNYLESNLCLPLLQVGLYRVSSTLPLVGLLTQVRVCYQVLLQQPSLSFHYWPLFLLELLLKGAQASLSYRLLGKP